MSEQTASEVLTDREYAIHTIERTLEASAALRKHLQVTDRVGGRVIEALRSEVPVSKSVASAGACAAELRKESLELLRAYEVCRHEMRAAFILPSVDEGMTIGDIGRSLGISRQLASRLVHEAEASAAARNRG